MNVNNQRLIDWLDFIQEQLNSLINGEDFDVEKFKRLHHVLTLTTKVVTGESKLVGANYRKLNK